MNKIIKISLLSLTLAFGSAYETLGAAPTQPTGTSEKGVSPKKGASAEANSSSSNKQEMRQKRKEERTKKLLDSCETTLKDMESKIARAPNIAKKKAALATAHAKLEIEAARDADLAESAAFHARRCKQYLFRAKDALEAKGLKTQELPVSKVD